MLYLDTYALVEIHNENHAYAPLLSKQTVTSDITLAEFYWTLLRKHNQQTADYWYKRFIPLSVPVPRELLIAAMRFRNEHASQNLSFIDCVGYVYAREHRIQFVTGDKEFKGMDGVLFIK